MSQPASSRFTAWLSGEERRRLRELAELEGTSENYFVRQAVRLLVDLPVSPAVRELVSQSLDAYETPAGRARELA